MTAPDAPRFATLIAAAIPPVESFLPTAEGPGTIQVERGCVLPLLATRQPGCVPPAAGEWLAEAGDVSRLVVVDRMGHRRRVYRPLLVYAWLRAYLLARENLPASERRRWEDGLRPWCDLLTAETRPVVTTAAGLPAAAGEEVMIGAWSALALFVAGLIFRSDAWAMGVADLFGALPRLQTPVGTWLVWGPADSPEAGWFHELAILHAAADYARLSGDGAMSDAVGRNALYHLRETQPDHATGQPWGLPAFLRDPRTYPLADQVLHAARMTPAGGVTSILLADALL